MATAPTFRAPGFAAQKTQVEFDWLARARMLLEGCSREKLVELLVQGAMSFPRWRNCPKQQLVEDCLHCRLIPSDYHQVFIKPIQELRDICREKGVCHSGSHRDLPSRVWTLDLWEPLPCFDAYMADMGNYAPLTPLVGRLNIDPEPPVAIAPALPAPAGGAPGLYGQLTLDALPDPSLPGTERNSADAASAASPAGAWPAPAKRARPLRRPAAASRRPAAATHANSSGPAAEALRLSSCGHGVWASRARGLTLMPRGSLPAARRANSLPRFRAIRLRQPLPQEKDNHSHFRMSCCSASRAPFLLLHRSVPCFPRLLSAPYFPGLLRRTLLKDSSQCAFPACGGHGHRATNWSARRSLSSSHSWRVWAFCNAMGYEEDFVLFLVVEGMCIL